MELRPRHPDGRLFPRIEVNPRQQPPSMVKDPRRPSRDLYLDWHGAVGDEGHLRRCPVCSCEEFFVTSAFPTATFMVLLIVFAIAAGLLFTDKLWSTVAFLAMAGSLTLIIMVMTPQRLVCYRCRSIFSKMPIARHQKHWESALGEHYRNPPEASPEAHPEVSSEAPRAVPPASKASSVDSSSSTDVSSVADSAGDRRDA